MTVSREGMEGSAFQCREQVSCLPKCCHRAWLSSGWTPRMALKLKKPHSHWQPSDVHKREVGGVLLILSEKHCLGSCPEHRLDTAGAQWRRLGSTLPLCAGPEGECSSHGSWFFWCQFLLFSLFPEALQQDCTHICAVGFSYRSGRRFLQGQEFTVPGVSWASVIFSGQALYHWATHTQPGICCACWGLEEGESHGWHFRRVSCMLCNQSQTVIPKTLGVG